MEPITTAIIIKGGYAIWHAGKHLFQLEERMRDEPGFKDILAASQDNPNTVPLIDPDDSDAISSLFEAISDTLFS